MNEFEACINALFQQFVYVQLFNLICIVLGAMKCAQLLVYAPIISHPLHQINGEQRMNHINGLLCNSVGKMKLECLSEIAYLFCHLH
jgi:hypothetical protein